jgi:hypothetical protein
MLQTILLMVATLILGFLTLLGLAIVGVIGSVVTTYLARAPQVPPDQAPTP